MALPNLSGSNIQDTYQRVLQTNGNLVYDGTGSVLPISFESGNISSSGTLYAQRVWLPEGGRLIFDNESDSDQYILGYDNYLTIDGDSGMNYKADNIYQFAGGGNMVIGTPINPSTSGPLYNLNGDYPEEKLVVVGNISASRNLLADGSYSSASIFAEDYFDDGININTIYAPIASPSFTGNITASGNISSSGAITASDISASNYLRSDALYVNSAATLGSAKVLGNLSVNGDIIEAPGGHVRLASPLTASAEISSSSPISASAFIGDGSGITGVTAEWDGTHTGTATFTGDITASGDISSSGYMYADQVYASAFKSINGSLISYSPSGATNIIGNDSDALKFDGTQTDFSAGPITTGETFTSTNYISATNITASGNISASGDLFFNNIDGGTF
jgi:hypothetical protein